MKKDILTLIAICAFVIVIFLPLFNTPFLYDEIDFLFTWDAIHDVHHIPQLLAGNVPFTHEGVYRPVRSIAYVLSYQLFHTTLFLYHLQALCIYLLCIIFVYFITKRLTENSTIAALTALIYGLSPMHVDNIANTTASFDTLGVLFAFIAWYCFQKLLEQKKQQFFLLTIFFSSLAYFTYEITLCLPVLFFLYAHFRREKLKHIWTVSFVAMPILYLVIREMIVKTTNRGELSSHLSEKITLLINGLGSYIVTAFFPSPPASPTSESIKQRLTELTLSNAQPLSLFHIESALYAIVIICFLVLGIVLYKRRSLIGFGSLWFFLSLIPVSGIAFQFQPLWGRYGILATYGTSLMLATIITRVIAMKPKTYITNYFYIVGLASMGSLILYYTLVTSTVLMTWQTFLPTLERQLHTMPESAQKHNQLGIIYTTYFQIDTGLGELNKAHILSPANMDIQANITKACLLSRAISHTITDAKIKPLCKT